MSKFSTEEACIAHFERIRWPEGLCCIRCGGEEVHKFEAEGKAGKDRYLYHCNDCRYRYSVTAGSIFHDSHMSLTRWFLVIYLICSNKKGVSAKELQRQLAMTYKTAWHMAHRIRVAMQHETYVGGKQKGLRGRAVSTNKSPIVAIKERTTGTIRMQAVESCSSSVRKDFVRLNANNGAEIHTG